MPSSILNKLKLPLEHGDARAIHQVRKLSRQAETWLKLTKGPKRQRRKWQALRRTAAPLRDHDVMGQHLLRELRALKVPNSELQEFRNAWQAQRQALVAALKWPDNPEALEQPATLKKRARRAVPKQARHLLEEGHKVLKSKDSELWHDWRKGLKFHRYTQDILGRAPKVLKETLNALGQLQDAETMLSAVSAPAWAFGHAEALNQQAKQARRLARRRVKKLWPELRVYFSALAKA